jgi:hypothetical protein
MANFAVDVERTHPHSVWGDEEALPAPSDFTTLKNKYIITSVSHTVHNKAFKREKKTTL